MDQIEYYGGATSASNLNIYYGATLKAWKKINLAKDDLRKSGIKIPFIYILTYEEALDVNSNSFSFPLRVWISQDENVVYTPPQFAQDAKEFRAIVNSISEESTLIISRMPVEFDNVEIYVAKDGLIVKSSNGRFYPVASDNSVLWTRIGFDDNLLIRLRYPGSGSWTVDGVIDRDNPYIKQMMGSYIEELPEQIFESFRQGFITGFKMENLPNLDHLGYSFPCLNPAGGYLISHIPDVANLQGISLGQLLKTKLAVYYDNIPSNLTPLQRVAQLLTKGKNNLDEIASLSNLHNALIKRERDVAKEHLRSFFEHNGADYSFYGVLSFFNSMNLFLKYVPPDITKDQTSWETYSELLDLGEITSYDIQDTLSFDDGQFRLLTDEKPYTEDGPLTIRFQSESVRGVRIVTLKDGTQHKISDWKQKVEIGIKIPHVDNSLFQALKGLKYSLPSQAGTGAKYAACKIENDKLVTVEGGIELVSINALKDRLKNLYTTYTNV